MIISCNTIVDRRDLVQYLTVSKSYTDNCTCALTELLFLKSCFVLHLYLTIMQIILCCILFS